MRKVTILIVIICLAMLTSCSINLFRPANTAVIDLDKEYQKVLQSARGVDTILILRSSDCQIYSKDDLITVYKTRGVTYSKATTTWGRYNVEPLLCCFKWDTIYSSLNKMKVEKPITAYHASVIEGDTTWASNLSFSGEQVWTFELITDKDTAEWETTSSERLENPSMEKTKVSNYIFSQTIYGTSGLNSQPQYGSIEYKRMPIISRKRRK